jgi:hypothetical protein
MKYTWVWKGWCTRQSAICTPGIFSNYSLVMLLSNISCVTNITLYCEILFGCKITPKVLVAPLDRLAPYDGASTEGTAEEEQRETSSGKNDWRTQSNLEENSSIPAWRCGVNHRRIIYPHMHRHVGLVCAVVQWHWECDWDVYSSCVKSVDRKRIVKTLSRLTHSSDLLPSND